ncbi:eukaryotic aspartyl protease family protein [Striga asiatica]|uniref:Eukaryotic aspartyl protease family protein n=1 Tax=Striga asiatica TaxID=4170 RepID=A0A5A7PPM1_STRAF|nr:eukaryotic aspartyl protease family protein [Striga asiatica]
MPPARILVVAALLLTAAAVGAEGEGLVLSLERANHIGLGVSQLRERDRVRHGRFLQQQQHQALGIVDFPVQGTYDPYLVGLYFTRVKLGNPPKEFFVQIDTGSNVLWVSCNPCAGCPKSSGLQIELEFFDPSSSSTASLISCSDQRCGLGVQTSDAGCSDQNRCGYTFHCSTSQSGDLTKPDRAVDGIFGFGQQGLSVISQLSSQGITPNAFSHCLKGEDGGGGILVLGEIVEPNIVYTPLVPSQPHYNVYLQSIAVNGQTLNIDSSVFSTSSNQGTIIDSGTTLAYLAEEAYDTFVSAITQSVSQSVRPLLVKGNQCYLATSSVSEIFPPVSLNFAGGASMILRPQDYLLQQNTVGGAAVWCIGIQKIEGQGITILGDLVLKDKIVVYDLAGQRIGWANYDCSSSVNVSTTTSTGRTEFFNAGQLEKNNSLYHGLHKLIQGSILALLLHLAFFGVLPFL